MINGYIDYLQNALGNNYIVVSEEKTDYPLDKNLCVLSQFQGVNYKSCVLFTYQMTVYTNKVVETMNELMGFSWEQNDINLTTNEFPFIKQLMSQPINKTNFGQMKVEYLGTIDITITLICSITANDIKSIRFDGELIVPTQVTITYQSVPDNQRNNNEELNSTNINEANLQYQVVMPCDSSSLYSKATNIMFGVLPKNTSFEIELELNDSSKVNMSVKMTNSAINKERSTMTTISMTFMK